jgi:beta-glucuronidase
MHASEDELYSEEYQVKLIKSFLDVADTKDYVVGMHVWNFADFRTGQSLMRVGGMNLKGVFTQDRKPKMAAHFLRERWQKKIINNK